VKNFAAVVPPHVPSDEIRGFDGVAAQSPRTVFTTEISQMIAPLGYCARQYPNRAPRRAGRQFVIFMAPVMAHRPVLAARSAAWSLGLGYVVMAMAVAGRGGVAATARLW
jgi:hypothetical protein